MSYYLPTTDHREPLWPCWCVLAYISMPLLGSPSAPPTCILHTPLLCHPLSLCFHWFLCADFTSRPRDWKVKSGITLHWEGNMTYLPAHSHKLSHVSCRVIHSLANLFHPTRQAFKYVQIIHANLNHAITLACLCPFLITFLHIDNQFY